MLQYCFQIFFIFILCAFIHVNHAIAQEQPAGEVASFSGIENRGKCTAEKCTCADIPRWNGMLCYIHWTSFPEIYLRQFKYLPERIFLGLRIYSVWLMDPDGTVADNFLEGILGLDVFCVKYSSIEAVPDLRIVKDSIRKVQIQSSRLTYLEGKHFQNLTSATVLSFYNNSIRHIDPDFFRGTDNVKVLNFTLNKLTYIPPELLNPMRTLIVFIADHNNLLHVDNLFTATRPMAIYLAFNNITKFSLPQNPQNSRWRFEMREMDLSYNFIKETSLSFSTCNINHDSILKINKLILNGNKILNLNNFLRCLEIKRLEIILNQIQYLTQKDFIWTYNIEELLLRENQIGRIDMDTFEHFNTSLRKLDLSFNRITRINGSVQYLYNLVTLDLSHNSIQTFADDEFSGLGSLRYLCLQSNQVKSLGTLQNLKNLRGLDIAHNNIIFIKPDKLPKTLNIVYLADFANSVNNCSPKCKKFKSSSLVKCKAKKNLLRNPIKCDCNLKPFLNFLEERQKKYNFGVVTDICLRPDNERSLPKQSNCPSMCLCFCVEDGDDQFMLVDCSSRNLHSVTQFLNNNLLRLEDNGTIYSVHRGHLPIQESPGSFFQVEDRSIGINLENNNLEFIGDAQLPSNLSRLYLSNNRLRLLPDSLLDNQRNLKKISLSGNPWICNCEALKFKKWLRSNRRITLDLDNIRCGISDKVEGKLHMSVIWKLHDSDLCPQTNYVMIFSVSLGVLNSVEEYLNLKSLYCYHSPGKQQNHINFKEIQYYLNTKLSDNFKITCSHSWVRIECLLDGNTSFFVICLTVIILFAKYKLNVKVLLYSSGFTFVKDGDDINHDRTFDAFISFSHEDDEFVIKEIVSEIENRIPTIRLCLHYRHFIAGFQIISNIIQAVENSKMTVVILTKNFLNSEWCLTEFRTAYGQTSKHNLHKIIVVKVGELPKDMDPAIKYYIEHTTYLTWGETHFWKKLLYVLPFRPAVKNQVVRNTGENDVVINCSFSEL